MTITTEYQFQATAMALALAERGFYVEYDSETSGVSLYTAAPAAAVEAVIAEFGYRERGYGVTLES